MPATCVEAKLRPKSSMPRAITSDTLRSWGSGTLSILVNPSARNRSATTYFGAMQMPGAASGSRTDVVSGGPSAARAGVRNIAAVPIRSVGDDLLRARFDEPHFVQAKRVISEGILGAIFVPFTIGELAQRLQRIVIASGKAAIDEPPRDACGFSGAELVGFEDGPQYAFGRDRIPPHVLAVASQHTAE